MKKMLIVLMVLLSSLSLYAKEENNSNEKNAKAFDVKGNKYIIRGIYGVATTSSLEELLTLNKPSKSPNHGKIGGIQVERYVYKRPYNFPVNVTLQSSFLIHTNKINDGSKEIREKRSYYTDKDSYELNFGIKAYWLEFPWSKYVRTRMGVSEGLSYISRVSNIERYNLYNKNQSNYLNYIDITMSFNAKDITRINYLEDTYIGIGISHRSGIFGTINGVSGGSNNVICFFETEL